MKLVVLGATGGTGIELVHRSIEAGHSVTAFVRSPEKLKPLAQRISIRQGNLLNSSEVESVLQGHDAVVSGFGPRLPVSKEDAHLLEEFGNALVTAMPRAGVRRVVVESVAFLFKETVFPPVYFLGRLLFPGVVKDAGAMEDRLMKSDLDWTIVRPPELTNGKLTGNYRVREWHLPRMGIRISRADVADYMVKCLDQPSTVRKIIGLAR